MEIVILGSGNVAHCFGHLLELQGHRIRQVISRHTGHAQVLAERLNASYTDSPDEIWTGADVYLLAVSDRAIAGLDGWLRLGKRIAVHTSGSIPLKAIANISDNTGVLYPLQSLRRDIQQPAEIPVLVEASDRITQTRLITLAESISSRIELVNSDRRMKLHLAGVICNNFTNYLFTLARDYCQAESLDFGLLKPLIQETFHRLERYDPAQVQTGPAIRGDQVTLEQHLELLADHPGTQEVYQMLSDHISRYYALQGIDPEH